MSPDRSVAPLTIRTLDDLVALVPYLLGFHPRDSLVVVIMADRRVQLTGRIDITDAAKPDCLAELVGRLVDRFGAAEQWFLAYDDDAEAAWRVLYSCAELVGAVRLGRLLHVNDRAWSADHPEGESGLIGLTAVATQAAVLGLSARASRAELSAQVVAPDDSQVAALVTEFDDARAWTESMSAAEQRRWVVELTADAAAERDYVRLAVLVSDPQHQVEVLRRLDASNAADAVACWTTVVAHCLTPHLAGPLGLLGVASWLTGDGATQNICLERLDQLQPLAPLAALLDWINHQVMPPSLWLTYRSALLAALREQSALLEQSTPGLGQDPWNCGARTGEGHQHRFG